MHHNRARRGEREVAEAVEALLFLGQREQVVSTTTTTTTTTTIVVFGAHIVSGIIILRVARIVARVVQLLLLLLLLLAGKLGLRYERLRFATLLEQTVNAAGAQKRAAHWRRRGHRCGLTSVVVVVVVVTCQVEARRRLHRHTSELPGLLDRRLARREHEVLVVAWRRATRTGDGDGGAR